MAHMHYKGTGKMHSFRGLLADGDQRKIRIQGPVGAIAWRITKFQVIGSAPGAANYEATTTISREEITTPLATINLEDDNILGVAFYSGNAASFNYPTSQVIIFDNALFVRNIWVSLDDLQSNSMNYYIELEEVKVSAAGVAQLSVAAARRLA
jgi:hypothetical protein